MDKNEEIKLDFFMSRIRFIKNLKDNEKTAISVVFYEVTGTTCILRVCKNRDLSDVCDALQKIKHPNVAIVYQYVYAEGSTYILEEMLSGKTVEKTVVENGAFSEADTIRIISQVCDGLAQFHKTQPVVVHNDIKTSNIMICDDSSIKVFDFDVARTYKKDATKNTVLFGTEEYAAPEHYGYGQSEPRTDIYSLGVTMHRMLTGEYLSAERRCTYKGRLKKVIEKCVEVNPANRYQSVLHLKKELESIEANNKKIIKISLAAIFLAIVCAVVLICVFTLGADKDNKHTDDKSVSETVLFSTVGTTDMPATDTTPADTIGEVPEQTTGVQSVTEEKKMTIARNLEGKLLSLIALNDGRVIYLEKAENVFYVKSSNGEEKLLPVDCDKELCRLIYNPYEDSLYVVASKEKNSSIYSLSKSLDMSESPLYTAQTSYVLNFKGLFFSDGMLYCNAFAQDLIDMVALKSVGSANCSPEVVVQDRIFDIGSNYYMMEELTLNGDTVGEFEVPGDLWYDRAFYADTSKLYMISRINGKYCVYSFDGQDFTELICLNDYKYYTDFDLSMMAVSENSVLIYDSASNALKEFEF